MRVWGFHPLRPGFPARSHFRLAGVWRGPITPAPPRRRRFGLLRFRSPLLAKSLLFSSPAGTKMFQFPAFASLDTGPSALWVDPFGNPGIEGYLHLPRTYRSLSRPSSPLRAKASPMRSCLLSSVTLITLSYPSCRACKPHGGYYSRYVVTRLYLSTCQRPSGLLPHSRKRTVRPVSPSGLAAVRAPPPRDAPPLLSLQRPRLWRIRESNP